MEFGIPIVVVLLLLVFVILLVNSCRRSRAASASSLERIAGNKEFGASWEDSWEGAFWEAQTPRTVTANLIIHYTDGAGFSSERAIRVCEFDNELYGGILIAQCHLRDAMRTFRFSRITHCVDADSRQQIQDIGAYLNALFNENQKSAVPVLEAGD